MLKVPFAGLSRDERIKAALLASWFFLATAALWLLKSSRVTSLLVHLGARETPRVRLAGMVAVALAVVLYSIAVNRLSRISVVRVTSIAFAFLMIAFWIVLRFVGPEIAAHRPFIWAFYMLVDVYTVVMIELFWTYTNDVVNQEQADRLYGAVGLGGILGGVCGGVVVDLFAHSIGPNNFLLVSAFIVALCIVLAQITERVLRPEPRKLLPYDRGDVRSAFDGVHEIRKSRYLMMLVALVIAYEFTATLTDFGVNVVFERAHLAEADLAKMYGRLGWIACGVALIVQMFVVPVVLPTKRVALLVPPFLMLASVMGVVVVPVIATAIVMASVDRGLSYSITQSTRESLYVPLNDAQKYKAKAFIDMFVDRAAKAGASILLLVLIAGAGSSVRVALLASCAAMGVWIASARRLGSYVSQRDPRLSIAKELARAETYAPAFRSKRVEVRETHISRVYLLDEDVFKTKKPVDLGFLDFRTLEQRRAACDAEVALNARLAPSVYRNVLAVRCEDDGRVVLGDGLGAIVDWAVHMTRMPDAERADNLLSRGALSEADIDRIASRLTVFHASCRSDEETARFGMPALIAHNVVENFAQSRHALVRYMSRKDAREVVHFQTAFLRRRTPVFEARAKTGRVRDGHGDLRLEHVYLDGRDVTIIDCIEFNERFRFADVCADLAFLSMDLAEHGRSDLAERLLSTYARESNDFDIYGVVDFYQSYRAFVRGKVSAMLASDPSASRAARESAEVEARKYFLLSLACGRKPNAGAAIYAVGGLIASGKSTIAERLRDATLAPIVDTDRTRKSLLGVAPSQPIPDAAWTGAYETRFTDRVYEEVLRRARVVVLSGRSVVIDASFRSQHMRRRARQLASALGVPFHFIECRAPISVCEARLAERERAPHVSDGRAAIFDDFRAHYQPVTELPDFEHVVVDTTKPASITIASLRAQLSAQNAVDTTHAGGPTSVPG